MTEKYVDLNLLETVESEELKGVIGGRRGADDPAGHDANDDKGGTRPRVRGRRGRGRRGHDQGPNHT